jgi:hypothetical protein
MKKKTLAMPGEKYWNMTRKHRITATMESGDFTFPGVKFDRQGNIKKRVDIEVEPFKAELIFENEVFLKYIIIHLRKYLMERLTKTADGFKCFGNEHLEDRWMVSEQFCEEMGIEYNLIQLLLKYLDYPTCEGDFLTDYSVEDILQAVRNYKEDDDVGQEKTKATN